MGAPVPDVDYKAGWCDNPDCICTQAGVCCEEYMGCTEEGPWCPRCGWHPMHHTAGVDPNGCRTLWPSEIWVHVQPGCRCKRKAKR